MKFIGIILLLLTSIFLIACSANQASNKISNSELENLASKYGGVYVFNEKFEKEITTKEKIRREAELAIVNASKTDAEMRKNLKGFDAKYPQTLSNGKPYYTRWIDYENQTGKKAEIPEIYINKIKEFMGDENYNKSPNLPILVMFYIDNNDEIIPIKLSMSYTYYKTKYGLFGDEGHGVRFKDEEQIFIRGGNRFVLINGKFERASKDK